MYKCPHTGQHSFDVIHFIGEEGASSYSPEYFAEESEHCIIQTIEGDVIHYTSGNTSADLFTGV